MLKWMLAFVLFAVSAHASDCRDPSDPDCKHKGQQRPHYYHSPHYYHYRYYYRARPAAPGTPGVAPSPANALFPVREYLSGKSIPPAGAGAYGIVVFQSLPTDASLPKLLMVCKSFIAHFPRSAAVDWPLKDQMVTVWPVDDPDKLDKADDCDFAVRHYDLAAGQSAIIDAERQHAQFDGDGPYLVGWSPSNTRGKPDQLVMIVDLSMDRTPAEIDRKFLFWKNKIVEDPSLWRSGFSIENIRVAIREFADQYGRGMLDAIKLIGGKAP
jgi:hypothetical protein